MAKHAAPLSIFSWAFLSLGLVMFALAGFGWSRHLADEGLVVAGNVHLAGEPLQGMGPDQVASAVSARANDLLTRELTIEYGPGELAVPFGDLG
ncbi:MAG TPA: hypothetical protein VFZ15_01135, partial [Acidimicrobiia bacterium]|nr:hypothetical protein [Acidimicrobiia bacterium]